MDIRSFVEAEQKKQKVSEVQGRLEDADALVFYIKHVELTYIDF